MREFPEYIWFALPWILAVGAAGLWYTRQLRAANGKHPRRRAASFYAGLAVVAVTVLSPLEHYGNQALWVAFIGFLLMTMVAAPLLVMGAPLTLAFRAGSPSKRRFLRAFYRSPLASAATFPIATWLGFAIVTYLWQFTDLTQVAAKHATVRELQLATLLGVAYLFWSPALCADPQRWRMAYPLRVMYVLVEMVHKALFGGLFLSMNEPFHQTFGTVHPSWAPSAMDDQRLSIMILWLGGNMIFVAALALLVSRWMRYEARQARRIDARLAKQRESEKKRRAALDQVFQKGV